VQHASTDRLHALDNLRALMMWLGIVLHVSVIHMVNDSPLPWHDDRSTPVADLLSAFIHTLSHAGVLHPGGLLCGHAGAKARRAGGMVRNRLRRLGLPFAIFWPPVFAASAVLALLFLHRMVRGTWGLDASIVPVAPICPLAPPPCTCGSCGCCCGFACWPRRCCGWAGACRRYLPP
jgi:glucan biosynthesis protein C